MSLLINSGNIQIEELQITDMATRTTIRAQFLQQIEETSDNSHFNTTEINDLVDKTIRKIAKSVNQPRKFDSGTQAIDGTSDYDSASDYIYLVSAYFGDKTIADDIKPLTIIRDQNLKYMVPSYLQTVSTSRGQPTHVLLVDRNTLRLYPTPDSTYSASGRKLWLYYVYEPAVLTSDSDSPDLPLVYHDLIMFYMVFLAYDGRLSNSKKAAENLAIFDKEIASAMISGEKEAEENMRFQWGFKDE